MKSKILLLVLLIAFAIPVFSQEPDMTLIPYRKGDLWGYANADRKIVITPQYNDANIFSEGFASVKKGTRYGYINKEGKVVIPFNFFVAKPFHIGYFSKAEKIVTADDLNSGSQRAVLFAGASLRADGYEICINSKGETMPQCPAMSENNASDITKPAVKTIETNYNSIQKPELFDKIVDDYKMLGNEDAFYIALKGSSYGVFNNKYEAVIPFEYTKIQKINISGIIYLIVEKNGLKGVIFGNGSPYINPENSKIEYISGKAGKNYFIVTKNGKTALKDANYQDLVAAEYADIVYEKDGGFILVSAEKLKGFYFLNGLKVTPKYTDIKPVMGGTYLMVKTTAGKTGYVGQGGEEFFEEN